MTHGSHAGFTFGRIAFPAAVVAALTAAAFPCAAQSAFTYENTLRDNTNPLPILADHPEFVEPLRFERRFLAPPVVNDKSGGLEVRSWRYWYNARGIIEMVNRLDARATAVIDLGAWDEMEAHGGKSFFVRQAKEVINPFLAQVGNRVALVVHTLPSGTQETRPAGESDTLMLDAAAPLTIYFEKTQSSSSSGRTASIAKEISRCAGDTVFQEDYEHIREYLNKRGIRHILVIGYIGKPVILPTHPRAADGAPNPAAKAGTEDSMSIERLAGDFNVFIVGDAVRTSFPGSTTPRYAVQAALANLSGTRMITQAGWVRVLTLIPGPSPINGRRE